MTAKYVRSLVLMLVIAIVLDGVVILLKLDYIYLAVATVVAYYIWLILGSFDFEELRISIKDIVYLMTYFISYFVIVNYLPFNDYIALFVGLITCILLGVIFFKKSIFRMIGLLVAKPGQ